MEKFTVLNGVAAPMLMENINTDLIAPSLMPGRSPEDAAKMDFEGDKMFANLRFHADRHRRSPSSCWTSRATAKRADLVWPARILVAAVLASIAV